MREDHASRLRRVLGNGPEQSLRSLFAIPILMSCASLAGSAAQAPSLDWAVGVGGDYVGYHDASSSEHATNGIAVYGAGTSCVTGSFAGSETFGVGQVRQTTLTSAGGANIFVASYDGSGALKWVKHAGGLRDDAGLAAAVDGAGNCYVTGVVEFLQGSIFIAKYTPAGDTAWTRLIEGGVGLAIAADAAGNSYVTGAFDVDAIFGRGEVNETTLTSAFGYEDVFVAKYDRNGSLAWAKQALDPYDLDHSYDFGYGIDVDSAGNVYVVGSFEGASVFGPGEANETLLLSGYGAQFGTDKNIFLAKYNSAGALQWARSAGGLGDEEGYDVAVEPAGASYVTGTFDVATFGAGEPSETNLNAVGEGDVFVAKYSSAGTLVWAKRAGGPGWDQGLGIALDHRGGLHVTGIFGTWGGQNEMAVFGPGDPNETTLTSAGLGDVFLAAYDASGSLIWAKQAGGANEDSGLDVAVDAAAKSYITGVYHGPALFGSGEANETTLQEPNDFFVARYDSDGWSPGTSVIRINAGELKRPYTDANGVVWGVDAHFLLGGISGTDHIYNTADVQLYRQGRKRIYQDFGYAIPVTPGDYYVTLKFAEQVALALGQRRFNVTIEGQMVLANFDILKEVPLKSAVDKTFAVTVTDGTLNIAFEKVVNGGIVSAIEVVPLN